ncbi:MAG: D-alanyl-D-alanine carboxypeptidase [Clostridia bacterium]|nr:D-alanyl-D-alanine carboxypeptidase [Clostridia bacterium]
MKDNGTRLAAIFLIVAAAFSALTVYAFSSDKPSVSADAAALYEPERGTFLYEKNLNKRLPMASTTKIVTALIALENLPPDKIITVDDRAVGTDGSSIYLEHGEAMDAESLIYALMLSSANDAAEALAYEISGSIDSFSLLMNERAKALGAKDTSFKNPHGLDAKDHYTTAHDLALITAKALENEAFVKICSTYKKTVTSNLKERTLTNHNKLLNLYDDAIGVKTGYTSLSGRSLVGAARKDGVTLISVTINAPDDWNDHISLLNYGFNNVKSEILLKENELLYEIPVLGGNIGQVKISNKSEIKITYIKKPNVRRHVELNRYFNAPIRCGDVLGRVYFTDGDNVIASTELVSLTDVNKKPSFFERIFG